jgi:RNA-binding protein
MLSSKERSRLAGIAQSLEALVQLGRAGPTAGLSAQLDRILETHELVKLRFGDHKESRKELARELAAATKSEVVRVIGNTAVFWRRNPDPEKRKIEL